MPLDENEKSTLFGALAVRAGYLEPGRLIEVRELWKTRGEGSLADFLVKEGHLLPAAGTALSDLVERKIDEAGGDLRAALASVAPDAASPLPATGNENDDTVFTQTMTSLTPPPEGYVLVHTIDRGGEPGDRYTLTRLHAKGGLGQVWVARDESLGRDVAFKEIQPRWVDEPAVWSRFLKEAQITGRLEHPGIVPVYELSHRPGTQQPFYTMRFVRGRTLSEAVRGYHDKVKAGTAGPLDLQELLTAFIGVANAVAYAHSKGVIHRDLKGDNVVLGDYGEVIVLDWGLAKVLGQADEAGPAAGSAGSSEGTSPEATTAGQVLGTPAFMAPEQASGRIDLVGPKSDVHGLGAILYDILTGRPPFTGKDTVEVLRHVVNDPPEPPRSVRPGAPAALEAICLKALAKDPEARYGSASDLAEDVRRFVADEPVSAYREPFLRRSGRWARRHRALVTGSAALLVTAVVALSVGTVLLRQKQTEIEQQRLRAEDNFRLARKAVDQYLTRVGDSPELKAKGLEKLRRQLFGTARDFYEQFATQRGDDPAVRSDRHSP